MSCLLFFRGLSLGIALTVYGREEEADTLIEQMTRDQDPILRYGGMYALALAYRGTSNNKAIHQLLHFAVSDVSDDVRRTAVLALGFVLCSEPEQVCIFILFCEIIDLLYCHVHPVVISYFHVDVSCGIFSFNSLVFFFFFSCVCERVLGKR